MLKRKRGQESGTGAAVLVAVITILIVVYIMFIPPAERDKILEGSNSYDSDGNEINDDDYVKINLLSEMPARLTYIQEKEVDHNLASINLYTKTSGMVLKEVNSLYTKRAVLTDVTDNLTLVLKDLENANNILLNFDVVKSSGLLRITLNGNQIFNKEIEKGQVDPIVLPKELLKNENVFVFSSNSVGAAFWNTHEYNINNIQLTGDITDVSARKSKLNFIVDEFEKTNLNKVKLRYFADCTPNDVGVLRITLNDCKVFTGIPDCNQVSIHELLPYCLSQGENRLELETERGHYLIDSIQVRSELKEARDFIYDFFLNTTQYNDIQSGDAKINLSMVFSDAIEDKEAKIIINGHETIMSTDEIEYNDQIKIFVNQGTNIVKILPRNDFYVAELNIDYWAQD